MTLTPSLADPRVHVVAAEVPMAGERSLAGPSHSLLFGMIEHVKGRPPLYQRGTWAACARGRTSHLCSSLRSLTQPCGFTARECGLLRSTLERSNELQAPGTMRICRCDVEMLGDNLQTGNRRSAQIKVLPEIKSSLGRKEEKKKKQNKTMKKSNRLWRKLFSQVLPGYK